MLPGFEFVAHERLIEPNRPQVLLPVKQQHADAAFAKAAAGGVHLGHHAADRLHLVFLQIGDRSSVAEVLIVARKEEDEIGRRKEIELRQQRRSLRPDAVNKLHRRRQQFRRRQLPRARCGQMLRNS